MLSSGGSERPAEAAELAMGLQLLRASSMASTRLQLALARRDRSQAMAALDGLVDIDAEIEGFVVGLTQSAPPRPEMTALTNWIAEQKAAINADKFSLACMISGPSLVSPPDRLAAAPEPEESEAQVLELKAPEESEEPANRGWRMALLAMIPIILLLLAGAIYGAMPWLLP